MSSTKSRTTKSRSEMDVDDRGQLVEEDVAREMLAASRELDRLLQVLPARINTLSEAKRAYDVVKAQINHCKTRISGSQSLLKTLRPH